MSQQDKLLANGKMQRQQRLQTQHQGLSSVRCNDVLADSRTDRLSRLSHPLMPPSLSQGATAPPNPFLKRGDRHSPNANLGVVIALVELIELANVEGFVVFYGHTPKTAPKDSRINP